MEQNETRAGDIAELVLKYLDTATTNIDLWLDLLHEDVTIEFPYADSAGLPHKVRGKEKIRNATETFLNTVPGIRFTNPVVFPCIDPHLAFAKYEANVRVPATGKTYKQSYIAMFKEAEGKIISMSEYYDPVKFNAAFK